MADAVSTTSDGVQAGGGLVSSIGEMLPQPIGGSLVTIGDAVGDTSVNARKLGGTLQSALLRVASLSIDPLLGTDGLLTPVLLAAGETLRPAVGMTGLTGPVTGPIFLTVQSVPYMLGNNGVSQLLASILNPLLTPLTIGTPGPLLAGLLGNGLGGIGGTGGTSLLGPVTAILGSAGGGGSTGGLLTLNGVLTPVTGLLGNTGGATGGLTGVLTPVTGLLGGAKGGTGGTTTGGLSGVLAPVTGLLGKTTGTAGGSAPTTSNGGANGLLAPVTGLLGGSH